MVIRIVLSLIIVALACVAGYYFYHQQESVCSVCQRPMHKVTTYRLSLSGGEVVEVCCQFTSVAPQEIFKRIAPAFPTNGLGIAAYPV
jgi:hypothetical protein